MKDLTCYIIDYLPESITVTMGKKKAEYHFRMGLNGSRGLYLTYSLEFDTWHGKNQASYHTRLRHNRKNFDMSSDSMIFLAEYIRSHQELEYAVKTCLQFLKQHGLVNGRVRNTRQQKKLFTVMTN